MSTTPTPPKPAPPTWEDEIEAAIERIEARLAALEEAAVTTDAVSPDELAKFAWMMRHGRRRPW